jgi:hypothetical protein
MTNAKIVVAHKTWDYILIFEPNLFKQDDYMQNVVFTCVLNIWVNNLAMIQ